MDSSDYRRIAQNLRGVTKSKSAVVLPDSPSDGLPTGFTVVDPKKFDFHTNGKILVVLGEPPTEEIDPQCELHNCDDMGCRWEHVLVVVDLEDKTWWGWNPFGAVTPH